MLGGKEEEKIIREMSKINGMSDGNSAMEKNKVWKGKRVIEETERLFYI